VNLSLFTAHMDVGGWMLVNPVMNSKPLKPLFVLMSEA
jgi:hypothetical protein